jgi:hypothetical protein
VALPLLPRHGERSEAIQGAEDGLPRRSAPRNDEKWRKLLAAYRAAEAEVRGFERATAGASFAEAARLEGRYGELGDVMYSALRHLLRAPAPDLAAVAAKLDLVVEHEVGTLEGGEACMSAIRADVRRISHHQLWEGVTKAAS